VFQRPVRSAGNESGTRVGLIQAEDDSHRGGLARTVRPEEGGDPGRRGQRRGPRPGLSADTIVDAAVRLADAEGLEAVSIARVAAGDLCEVGFPGNYPCRRGLWLCVSPALTGISARRTVGPPGGLETRRRPSITDRRSARPVPADAFAPPVPLSRTSSSRRSSASQPRSGWSPPRFRCRAGSGSMSALERHGYPEATADPSRIVARTGDHERRVQAGLPAQMRLLGTHARAGARAARQLPTDNTTSRPGERCLTSH
jgi:hypothetical protein